MKFLHRFVSLALVVSMLAQTAQAAVIPSIPYNLTNGSLADATQVMGNFNTIVTDVNANAATAGVNSNITSLVGLTTPVAPTYGGTVVYTGGTTAGTANAQTLASVVPSQFALTAGNIVTAIVGTSNTAATTLNVAGTGVTAVYRWGGSGTTPLVGGELVANSPYQFYFDGTHFIVMNPSGNIAPKIFTLEEFGGVGDGSTDNLAAFNAAITAMGTFGIGVAQAGGCIQLGAGTYYVSATVPMTGKHGLCIQGIPGIATVVKSTGNYPVFTDAGTYASPTGKLTIRDMWIQCGGKANANANGIQWAYTNTGLVENVFETGCNHGLDFNGVWQVRVINNRWDGGGSQQNNICMYMGLPSDAADVIHNNAVVAIHNVCQNPAQYGLRWLDAQGSVFAANQWMQGINGIYGCDPGTSTFADGSNTACQFVFFNGDQTDTTSAQGIFIKKGLASTIGYGINLINPWVGSSNTAAIDIQGADGVQIVAADVETGDIGINLFNDTRTRASGRVYNYNQSNNSSAAVALNGSTDSTIDVRTEGSHVVGYNGIVENNSYARNQIYGAGTASCAMALALGATSNTAGTTACEYEVTGFKVHVQYYMAFTGSLSGTGSATLTGLPIAAQASGGSNATFGATNVQTCFSGCASLSGAVIGKPGQNSTVANLYWQNATGVVALTDSNFGTSPLLEGSFDYFKN